jgi:hypothetical protein
MAVVLMEGFDHLNQQYTAKGWSVNNFTGAAGRYGGRCVDSQNSVVMSKVLPSSYTTLFVGFATKIAALPGDMDIFLTRNGSTNVVRIQCFNNGLNRVFRLLNAAGTVLATGTTPIVATVWNYLELKVVVSASAECSASSVNTGALAIDNVGMNGINGVTWSYDDLYVVDTSGSSPTNTWLGDVKIETLFPTGNGNSTAWTGAFGDWDDTTSHDTDTTYVSSSTPGDKETSTLGDLTVTAGTVFAVQTNLVARKDDAGSRTIAPVLRIGGTDYDGTTSPGLTATYTDYTQLHDRLDPAGNAWSVATVNAMEAGVKEVA